MTKLSNVFLLQAVWAVAITGLLVLASSIAAAQPPATPIYSMRTWDDTDSIFMWFDVGFNSNGNSLGGNIWLLDSDRVPVGTDPLLRIEHDAVLNLNTLDIAWSQPGIGAVSGSLNDLFVVHNGVALALDFTDKPGTWVVPEPGAVVLLTMGLGLMGLALRGRQ